VEPREAQRLLQRFGTFADAFSDCFGRRGQRAIASQYIEGLFNDSERKSMQAMHGRLSDAVTYQALQHFVTHSPWETAPVWDRLRTLVPNRTGILAVDDTGLPKQGKHSVGVKRQYCGAKGKIANCQVAVSSVLISDRLPWPLAFDLYIPREWVEDPARWPAADVANHPRFREKWRIALAQVRQVVKAGFQVTALVADADYGATAAFRRGLERLGLRYAVAVRWSLMLWTADGRRSQTAAAIAAQCPEDAWQRVVWAHGTKGPLAARFTAVRVRPAKSRGERWLLCERSLADDERKYYLLNVEATARLEELVGLARSRWPIEQQYRELKDELGFDHFEGRSYRGWTHHTVLTAIAFTFLQIERHRSPEDPRPTLPHVRLWVREIMAILYIANNRKLLNLLVSFQRNPPLRR
jgi:SRSO17 transposase